MSENVQELIAAARVEVTRDEHVDPLVWRDLMWKLIDVIEDAGLHA